MEKGEGKTRNSDDNMVTQLRLAYRAIGLTKSFQVWGVEESE